MHTYHRPAGLRAGIVEVTHPLVAAIYVQITPQTIIKKTFKKDKIFTSAACDSFLI